MVFVKSCVFEWYCFLESIDLEFGDENEFILWYMRGGENIVNMVVEFGGELCCFVGDLEKFLMLWVSGCLF